MDCKSLMIGDWVMTSSGMPRRVMELSGIIEDGIILEDGTESGFGPIPLTPEILEKNGYRYEHMYGPFYRSILGDYAIDREPTISIGWNGRGEMCEWDISDGKRGASYGRHLLGVHELQHALRLCGLDELADNFKIE